MFRLPSPSSFPRVLSGALAVGIAATAVAQSSTVGWADWCSIEPVALHAMAYDAARQRIVSFGGSRAGSWFIDLTQATWEWNGASWYERAVAGAPPPRADHSMAYDSGRRRVVLFGGVFGGGLNPKDDTWEWDGSNWTNPSPATAPSPRAGHAMAYDSARQRTVLFGGYVVFGLGLADTWEWDGSTWTNVSPASAPPPRYRSGLCFDPVRGVTVLHGGIDASANELADTWEWDGATWTQVVTSAAPLNGVLVYEASRSRTTLVAADGALWDFDGAAWTQRAGGGAGTFGEFAAVYDDACQEIVRFDARNPLGGSMRTLAVTSAWNGSAWVERRRDGGSADDPDDAPALAFDPLQGRVLALAALLCCDSPIGGVIHESHLKAWDGSGWTEQGVMYHPLGVIKASQIVFDTRRGVLVSFGGQDADFCGRLCPPTNRLAEWNGTTWTFPQPLLSPGPRMDHAMAFDAARNETVLFSGFGVADTWVWDGTNWTDRTTASSPSARGGHGMAFDVVHQRTVLFGGSATADTWEWDGAQWLQRNPAHQPPAGTAALCWHPGWQRVVAYVGSELWSWDGSDWTQIITTQPLPASNGRSMAYDPTRDALIVAGDGVTRILGTGVVQAAVATIGAGCASTARVPSLSAPPPALGDAGFGFALDGVPANSACVLGIALQQQPVSIGGCTFHLGGVVFTVPLLTSSYGHADAQLSVPFNRALLGVELFAQGVALDPLSPPLGLTLSNALRVTVGE